MTKSPWPIWVISLTDNIDRRGAISKQFESLGLDFSFLDAIDGRVGLPAEFEVEVDRPGTLARHGYPMSDGEYACALSHQHAYREIAKQRLPGAVILEDDAILTQRFREFCDTRSYEAAPLIQFFFFDAQIWKGRAINTSCTRLQRLFTSAWMAVGYSISAEAAATMLKESSPLRGRADWPCDTANLIGHYITMPRIVLHPDPEASVSTLDASRCGLIPPDFDFSAGYALGWRRLLSLASWRRFIKRPFKRRIVPGFQPSPGEALSMLLR